MPGEINVNGRKQRAAINRLSNSVRSLIAQGDAQRKQINKTQGAIVRLLAIIELLIEKGIISHDEINEKVKYYLDKREENSEGSGVQSSGAGADAGDSGDGEPGLLPEASSRNSDGESGRDHDIETEGDTAALDESDSTSDTDKIRTGGIDGKENG